ncbi:hypothetical protein [Actinomadura craniellae]|nr:hypothetical protein [Actinomadura craniellae]
MPIYDTYVRNRLEDARNECAEAEVNLVRAMENGDELADAVAEVAWTRALASWWDAAVTAIDHEGTDPVDALAQAREAAHRTLTDRAVPRAESPIAHGLTLARIEAARSFYQGTKHLDEITTGSPS